MESVKLGVVGTGSVALRGLLPHLVMDDIQDSVCVTAVCDVAPGRARAAADKFGVDLAYESLDELLDSGTVDAVTIATPIGAHFEQGMRAIEAGVHVHFNKAMCLSKAEADQLIEAAKKRNVKIVASPGQMLRPHYQVMRRAVQLGLVGQPLNAICGGGSASYHLGEHDLRSGSDVLTNINPEWYYRKPGGGPLWDMIVYALHALTGIVGPARRVTAMSGIALREHTIGDRTITADMDDNTSILVDFGDTFFGFVYGTPVSSFGIKGDPIVAGTAGALYPAHKDGRFEVMVGDVPATKIPELNAPELTEREYPLPHSFPAHQGVPEAHVYEDIMQLVDLIREGTPTIATPEHARHVIEIFEAAYKSASEGVAVDLETTFEAANF